MPLSSREQLDVEVVRTLPHDPTAYTQGLVMSDGRLFESTGREGDSTVREVDPDTGRVLDSSPLAPDEFGEGLTMTDDGQLVQLTWLTGVAYRWDADTLGAPWRRPATTARDGACRRSTTAPWS